MAVTLGLVLRRDGGAKRVQRRAVTAGGGDGAGSRKRVVHRTFLIPNKLARFFVMAELRPGHPRLPYVAKTWMPGTGQDDEKWFKTRVLRCPS
jgi:hypothetical protein